MSKIETLGRRMLRRLRAVLRRGTVERELDDELRFHVEMETEYRIRAGLDQESARAAALRDFGAVSRIKEDARAVRGIRLLDDLAADLRYAWRTLGRSPVFATVAVLTIALAIGTTTAVFSLADAVLLRPLSVRAPGELVFLNTIGRDGTRTGAPPYPAFERIRGESRSFDRLAAFAVDHLPVVMDGEPEQVLGQIASGNYFELLGVEPVIGRTFTTDDERLDPPVAVVSHQYWQRRFGGRADVLGKIVRFNGYSLEVVGVTPPEFVGLQVGNPVEVTLPITIVGERQRRNTRARWFSIVARLASGATADRARAESDRILQDFEREVAATAGASRPVARIEISPASHGMDRLRTQLSKPLLLLVAVVAGVLAIACANIAGLLLVRAEARRLELAVRSAIGAARGRLVRQLLAESLLLFAIGTAFGVVVARGVGAMVVDFLSIGRIPIVLDLELDYRVLAFVAGLCLVTGMVSGLVPALRGTRGAAAADLRLSGSSKATSRSALSLNRWLIVVQVAASVIVLLNAGLLTRTLQNLRATDHGFRADAVLTLSVHPLESPQTAAAVDRMWLAVLDRVRTVPGVRSASLSVLTPLSGRDPVARVEVVGQEPRSDADRTVHPNYVSADYFETLGIRLHAGRSFMPRDDGNALEVAILNDAAARFYFPGRSALGGRIALDGATGVEYEIVGIAADAKHRSVRDGAPRFVYVPLAQAPDRPGRLTLAVRTQDDPMAMTASIRDALRALDGDLLVSDVMTMERQMDQALLEERLVADLSAAFGGLGLLLAGIGLYGLIAYTVVRRTKEIGIRASLGASPQRLQRLILRDALGIVGLGIVIGLPLGVLAARAVQGLLYGVSPADPMAIAASITLLAVVAGLAAYLPARRAARIDPVLALASE